MGYRLGRRSLAELNGVNQRMIDIVQLAIQYTDVDFSVHDGIRTVAEQENLVESGASQTMNSKHLIGQAVDLVPYINGKLRWEWQPIYKIALAVRRAAKELNIAIRWGGNWTVNFTETDKNPMNVMDDYINLRRSQGRRPFCDGPHFELTV